MALVTAAIALWNTVYLGRALDTLRRRGEVIPDTLYWPTWRRSAGSTSISPATISGAPAPRSAPTGSGRYEHITDLDGRRSVTCSRFTPPTVLSCPFYGVTPDCGSGGDEDGHVDQVFA